MRILDTGNIGIGYGTPSQKLVVKGTTSLMATNSTNVWMAYTYTDNTFRLNYNGAGDDEVSVTSAGVVNIGDSSPNADGSGALNVYSATSGALSQFVHSAGNGGLRLGGTGAGSAAHLVFSNDYNNNSWTDEWTIRMDGSDDSLRFLSGGVTGTERLRITSGGKVGVPAPAESSALFGINGASTSELTDSSPLYNQGNPCYLQIKNTTDDISDPECGIILQPRNSSNGSVAIFAKRTGSFTSDLVYRVRTGSSTSAERLRIKNDGKVGVGVADPNQMMEITNTSGTGSQIQLRDTSTGNASSNGFRVGYNGSGGQLWNFESTYVRFATNNAERLRITSGGQLNFGGNLTQTGFTASITRNSSETDILRIKGNGGNAFIRFEDSDASSSFTLGADDAVGSGGFALYDRSDSAYRVVVDTDGKFGINTTSPGSLLSVSGGTSDDSFIRMNNEEVGLYFGAWGTGSSYPRETTINGTRFDNGTSPWLRVAGQGGIKFCVDLNNERLRIDSNSRVISGGSFATSSSFSDYEYFYNNKEGCGMYRNNAYASCGAHIEVGTDATDGWASLYLNRFWSSGEDERMIDFRISNTVVGTITANTSGTTYNTTSDIRLKTDINPISDATDKLMNMNPVTHKWKEDPDGDTVHGFIAQEMQNIAPEAVHGEPDGEMMMGMDYGRITPIIVAALQDAIEEINTLKQRISELEN